MVLRTIKLPEMNSIATAMKKKGLAMVNPFFFA